MSTLSSGFAGFICDLDGVVYRGAEAVPHAVESLDALRGAGKKVAYATNNAARTPATVAEHLRSLGIELEVSDVVNSSQAGARRVAEMVVPGSAVLAVGGPGVTDALIESGLTPVAPLDLEKAQSNGDAFEWPVAVLQGYGPDVSWHDLAQAAFSIQHGAVWIATNDDSTLPLAHGLAPGNGSLVGAVRNAVDVAPIVVGKPHAPLYEYSAKALGLPLGQVLALGDRLNTDIAGAVTTGIPSLYVTTGVSSPIDVALAGAEERPTYLGVDLRVVNEEYEEAHVASADSAWTASCGNAVVAYHGECELGDGGTANQRLRAFVAAVWAARDAGAEITESELQHVPAWIEAGA